MRIKKMLIIALSILSAASIVGILPSCGKQKEPEKDNGPKYIAHRGYSQNYVDNSEAAFCAAASMGFWGIETDIRMTKDGYFVCTHDDTVKYADGTEKKIANTKRDALLEKPVKNDKTNDDVYLCTFEAYLRACKGGDKVAVIELKDYFGDEDIEKILTIIDEEYDRKKVAFISFLYAPLLSVQEADSSIELQYLSQKEDDPNFERCLRNGIHIDVRHDVYKSLLTEELVETFHDAGLKVNVWTVNEGTYLEIALNYGVDYITTDLFSGD